MHVTIEESDERGEEREEGDREGKEREGRK